MIMIDVNKTIEIVEFCEKSNYDNFVLILSDTGFQNVLVHKNGLIVMKICFFLEDKNELERLITYFKKNGFIVRKDGENL